MLDSVNVAIGVTGSIAAVRTVQLVNELQRKGAEVRAIMSDSARDIVHPWSLEWATEHSVITELTGATEHVALFGSDGWADVYVIAPATANTIGKIASSIDDTPVTTCATTAIGAGVPLVVAPAMHEPMSDHPGVTEAIDQLCSWDVKFVEATVEEGKAKMATDESIIVETARAGTKNPLADNRIVVTSGPTAEPIDPVRVLATRASGRTGRAIARACYVRGADVRLLHNDQSVPYAEVRAVQTAAEMTEAALDSAADADALVSAAAIADYTVEPNQEKLQSGHNDLSLELVPTPKLLEEVRKANEDLTLVGFKTESNADDAELERSARSLLEGVGCAFVVANDASVMGKSHTRTLLVGPEDTRPFQGEKSMLGELVAEELVTELSPADFV